MWLWKAFSDFSVTDVNSLKCTNDAILSEENLLDFKISYRYKNSLAQGIPYFDTHLLEIYSIKPAYYCATVHTWEGDRQLVRLLQWCVGQEGSEGQGLSVGHRVEVRLAVLQTDPRHPSSSLPLVKWGRWKLLFFIKGGKYSSRIFI